MANEMVLWRGGLTSLQFGNQGVTDLITSDDSPILQPRFFLPAEVIVGRYGVVGMVIADNRPEYRWVSYDDGEWTGIGYRESDMYGVTDPVKRAHFLNTESGFSLLRTFALPAQIAEVFDRDKFLGEPMIEKCACDSVFDEGVEFDERRALPEYQPVKNALPLMETIAQAAWHSAGIPGDKTYEWKQYRTWISFHGWFVFSQAIVQAQLALEKAIGNFDYFLSRQAAHIQPYTSTELIRTSNALPEKP